MLSDCDWCPAFFQQTKPTGYSVNCWQSFPGHKRPTSDKVGRKKVTMMTTRSSSERIIFSRSAYISMYKTPL